MSADRCPHGASWTRCPHEHPPPAPVVAKKGPWFWSFEGVWLLKRQLFDEFEAHAGYELLDGDYDDVAAERDVLLDKVEDFVRSMRRRKS
jgi:hypothetical protein